MSGGVRRFALDDLQVGGDGLGVGIRIFLLRDAAREQRGDVWFFGFRPERYHGSTSNHLLLGRKVENELAGDGLEQFAIVPEGDPVPVGEGGGFEQGIVHAGDLLLHGLQRLANDGRAHFLGTQVADFFDLQEVKKRVVLSGGHQSSFFPTGQLTRREPQNAKQVGSTVSVHGCMQVLLLTLSGSRVRIGKWKEGFRRT